MLLLTAPYYNLHHSDSSSSRLHEELSQVWRCWFQQRGMTIQQGKCKVVKKRELFNVIYYNTDNENDNHKFYTTGGLSLKKRKLTETKEMLHCFHTVWPVPHSWPHHGNGASGLINDVGAGEMDEERRFRP